MSCCLFSYVCTMYFVINWCEWKVAWRNIFPIPSSIGLTRCWSLKINSSRNHHKGKTDIKKIMFKCIIFKEFQGEMITLLQIVWSPLHFFVRNIYHPHNVECSYLCSLTLTFIVQYFTLHFLVVLICECCLLVKLFSLENMLCCKVPLTYVGGA